MPGLIIRFILIATIIVSSFSIGENLAAQESNQPFLVQPKASFAPNNFTVPSDSAPVPPAPRSSAQLHRFRDAFTASPAQVQQPVQSQVQQIQTMDERDQELPSIQQVAAIEPLPKPLPKPTAPAGVEEVEENGQIEVSIEVPTAKISSEKNIDPGDLDELLDKPIGSSKPQSGKGLLEKPKFTSSIAPLVSVFGSLLIVISAFFVLVLFLKKVSPKGNRLLPSEAFENLGRAVLTQKLQLHLLRLGNRLILVSMSPDGVSPVTEITDPDEVVTLLGMCRQLDPNSATEFFRKTINSFAASKDEDGYFGTDVKKTSPKPKTKSKIDLYSEPDESLAEMLAKGGQHG